MVADDERGHGVRGRYKLRYGITDAVGDGTSASGEDDGGDRTVVPIGRGRGQRYIRRRNGKGGQCQGSETSTKGRIVDDVVPLTHHVN